MSRKIGLVLGLFLFIYSLFSTPPANMSEQAWVTAFTSLSRQFAVITP